MYKKTNIKQGKCPKCSNELLVYNRPIKDGDKIYFPVSCDNCYCNFKEYYNIKFDAIFAPESVKVTK